MFEGDDRIYAYAIGILAGTLVQLLIPAFDLRNTPFQFSCELRLAQPGRAPGPAADAAGDDQPRPDQLQPADQQLLRQPRLRPRRRRRSTRRSASTSCRRGSSRWRSRPSSSRPWPASPPAARTTTCGRRWPTGCARSSSSCCRPRPPILVLSEPMIRLVYQRGEFTAAQTDLVATALFWFAFSLPTNGLFLLLTRTFFSLQRPWIPTAIAGRQPGGHRARRARPLRPLRGRRDRRRDGDRDRRQRRRPVRGPAPRARRPRAGPACSTRRCGSASPRRPWPAVSYGVWDAARRGARAASLGGQIVSLGAGLAAGGARLPGASPGCCASPSWSRSCACCARR